MEMRIGTCNKLGFLTDATAKPALEEATFDIWIAENNRVKSLLISSMTPSLMQGFIRLPTTKDTWEVVSKTFYDDFEETCLFELIKPMIFLYQISVRNN
jgi:hypothetical protein